MSSLLIIAFAITSILAFDSVFEMEVRLKKPENMILEGFYPVERYDELKRFWSKNKKVGKGV